MASVSNQTELSTFALWFEAITCEDTEWLALARSALPLCARADESPVVASPRSPGEHQSYGLRAELERDS